MTLRLFGYGTLVERLPGRLRRGEWIPSFYDGIKGVAWRGRSEERRSILRNRVPGNSAWKEERKINLAHSERLLDGGRSWRHKLHFC